MVHLDVKKVGRIPDGGGWRVHGRGSDQKRAIHRAKTAGVTAGYVYLHSAIDGFSRLAYTEPIPDEKAATAAAFLARAKVWFAAHGITHIHRIVTDNGSCYRSGDSTSIVGRRTRHQKTRPFTPRHNGKVERYQRILAEELLYAREYGGEDDRRAAIAVWNIHYNYHRPHSAAGGKPPATRLPTGVTNLRPSYTYSSAPPAKTSRATPNARWPPSADRNRRPVGRWAVGLGVALMPVQASLARAARRQLVRSAAAAEEMVTPMTNLRPRDRYVYLLSATDGYHRLASTEHLADEPPAQRLSSGPAAGVHGHYRGRGVS